MTVKNVFCIFNPATRQAVCTEVNRDYTARDYLGTVNRDYWGKYYRSDILTVETPERAAAIRDGYNLDGFRVYPLDPCVCRIIPKAVEL